MELKTYSKKELLKELNITNYSWDNRREEYLEWFKLFFDYEVIFLSSGKKGFKIIEIFSEYEPLPRKKKAEEIKSFYKQKTAEIVDKQPLNTGSNIARIIVENDNKYDHAELTATRYVRPIINEDYDRTEYYWCFINYQTQQYEPLTEEQVEYLRKCFNTVNSAEAKVEEAMKYVDAYYHNNLDKQMAQEMIFNNAVSTYEKAMDKFKDKFNCRPMAVPMLVSKDTAFNAEIDKN